MKYWLGFVLAGFMASAWAAQVEVVDAWVREAPPNAPMMAGYLTLRNPGREAVVLMDARSPQFKKVEIHRSSIENGMARMEKQQKVELPAGGEIRFHPGGYHLMLMYPVKRLRGGDRVRLELILDGGERLEVVAPVRRDHGGMGHPH